MAARVEKTRGSQTLTESGFWSMIRSVLRKNSMYWKPVQDAKNASRRLYKGENKRQKFEYQCCKCKKWFKGDEVEVDHIIEAGSLKDGGDVKDFIERLFCEKEGLQVLCKNICHREKTNSVKVSKKLV